MNHAILKAHSFQFIRWCLVIHPESQPRLPPVINTDAHILHIVAGHGTFFLADTPYELEPGVCIAIPPFQRYSFILSAGFEMRNIHYQLYLEDGRNFTELAALPVRFVPPYFGECLKLFDRMQANAVRAEAGGNDWLDTAAAVHELVLLHLRSQKLFEAIPDDERLNRVCQALRRSDCRRYEAAKMAKLCCLSVSQMNRRFMTAYRISPRRFWAQARFQWICRELRNTCKKMSEIALEFGFFDEAHLARWFRNQAGMTPAQFRRRDEDIAC